MGNDIKFRKNKIKELFCDRFFFFDALITLLFTVSLNRKTILEELRRTNCIKQNIQFLPRAAYDVSILINHDKNNVSYS